jgi:hypothetical protein
VEQECGQEAECSKAVKGKQKRVGTKAESIEWLIRGQKKIKDVDIILIIGGGALGIRECVSFYEGRFSHSAV